MSRYCAWYGLQGCACETFPFSKDGSAPAPCKALRGVQPAYEVPTIRPKKKKRSSGGPSAPTGPGKIHEYIGKPCAYCATAMTNGGPHRPTRDHVVPRLVYRRNGWAAPPNNKVIVCYLCNQHKGAKTIERWLASLQAKYDPRAPIVEAFIASRERGLPAPRLDPVQPRDPPCVTDCVSSKDSKPWRPPRWA